MGRNVIRGEKERNYAVEIVNKGGTFEDASMVTGFTEDYIRQLCTKAGVYKPKFKKDEERREKALIMLENGYFIEDIVDILQYATEMPVRNIAKQNNIKPLTKIRNEKEKRNKIILSYRSKCKSYSEISKITGINECIISSVCRKNGFNSEVIKNTSGTGQGEKRKCIECGKPFECSPGHNKIYCSRTCQRKKSDKIGGIKRRAKIVVIDRDITIKKLYDRDNGVCHICGKLTDWNDYEIINNKKQSHRNYPSIDHIVPVSHGGVHSWGNVALAHLGCNAKKCDHE